jgi:hypothetical protein
MYFNVSFTLNGAGGGIILICPKGDRLLYVIRLHFYMTNNVCVFVCVCVGGGGGYEALVNGMPIIGELRV